MLNYLWAGMTLTGILWGALHGQMTAVTDGAIQASKEAVTLCITMLGVMTLWTGVLEIGHAPDWWISWQEEWDRYSPSFFQGWTRMGRQGNR